MSPLAPPPDAGALVHPVTITIDQAFADWTAVLADPDNTKTDPVGTADPDAPHAQADISQVAATFNATNLFGFVRINSTSTNQRRNFRAYLDLDGDGLMTGAAGVDRVAIISYNPSGGAARRWWATYTPQNPAGDPLLGNGSRPPGTINTPAEVTDASFTASTPITTQRIEFAITWGRLGVASGSPVNIQFAALPSTTNLFTLSNTQVDNASVVSMRHFGVTIVPNTTAAAELGSIVTYSHTVTNTGNGTETFNLTATSSLGWNVAIKDASTGALLSSVVLARNASRAIIVEVTVPANAPPGSRDVTTVRATHATRPTITATATDTTVISPVTVDPDRTGSIAPGNIIQYVHTVTNASSVTETLSLSATSSQGWTVGIFTTSGTPINSVTLAGGTSREVLVRVTVPAGTALGTVDVARLRAALASTPDVFDEATAITTVRAILTLEPNNSTVSGLGRTVTFQHTVVNSSVATRTIALTAASSLGWSTQILDSDGTTPITSVTLGPFGASRTIYVRVIVPTNVATGATDVTTARATHAASGNTAMATNTTNVQQLVTYDSDSLTNRTDTFGQGSTVWALGTSLPTTATVRFRWLDPSGTQVFQSAPIEVDGDGEALSSYPLSVDATPGVWTCVVVNAADNSEITRTPFTVLLVIRLSLTLPRTAVDFGALSPDVPSAIETLEIRVSSNVPCTLTRTTSGDISEMGFTIVSGPASRTVPVGATTLFDQVQAIAPWTTTPNIPLQVTLRYTLVP